MGIIEGKHYSVYPRPQQLPRTSVLTRTWLFHEFCGAEIFKTDARGTRMLPYTSKSRMLTDALMKHTILSYYLAWRRGPIGKCHTPIHSLTPAFSETSLHQVPSFSPFQL